MKKTISKIPTPAKVPEPWFVFAVQSGVIEVTSCWEIQLRGR